MSKARELAELGAVYDSGALSNRNLIINGAMQVAQKGTSATTSNNSSTSTVDRFIYDTRVNGASSGNFTIEQVTDAPTGFEYSFKITNDDNTTIGSSGGVELQQFIEGYNTAHLGWGASGAKGVTLSFWVKASYTGTQGVYFPSSNNGIAWLDTFTINTANTWEYKTLYIEGPTSGTWYTTTGRGMMVRLILCSNRTAGTTKDWTNTANAVSGQTNTFGTTTSSTFQITGVQLEVGESATPFEHLSYGDELERCKRYFIKYGSDGSENYIPVSEIAATQDNYRLRANYLFSPEMRATPSLSYSTLQVNNLELSDSNTVTNVALAGQEFSRTGISMFFHTATISGQSGGQSAFARVANSDSGYLYIDAEL